MTNFVKQGISIKATLIAKADGKEQLMMRAIDPYQGDVHKYLCNITRFDTPKPVMNKDKTSVMYYEMGTVTGYHKGAKPGADVSNRKVEYTVLQQYHTFPEIQRQQQFAAPQPQQFAAPTAQITPAQAPIQAQVPMAPAAPVINSQVPSQATTVAPVAEADLSELPFNLKT